MINSRKINLLPIMLNQSSSVSISRPSTTPSIRNINIKAFADVPISTPKQSSSISTEEETKLIEFAKMYQHQAISSQVLEPKKVTTSFLLKHLDEKQRKSVTSFLKSNNIPINDSTFVNMNFIGYIPESLSSKIINLIEVNGKYFEVNEERTYKSIDSFLKENNIGLGEFLFYDNNSKKVQTIDKAPTLGQKVDTAITTAALVSLVVPAAVLGGAPAAGAIAFGTTVYFGARAVYTIADDLKHGVRTPLKFIKNAGWVMLGAGGLSGKAGKYALGLAAAGSKGEKAAQVVINISKVGNIGGAATILGSLSYEGGNGLKEIMDKDVPYDKKMEMIKYAAVQLGLMVVVTIKGKTFTFKDGKMPKELIPSKAVQLETDKILLKHGAGAKCLARIWANTVTKGKETVQTIENFYNTAKSAGKKAGDETIKYLSDLCSEGTQTLKDLLIIFADKYKLPLIPEKAAELAFAGGPRLQQSGQVRLGVPNPEQVERARSRIESTGAYFASDPARKILAAGGGSSALKKIQGTNIPKLSEREFDKIKHLFKDPKAENLEFRADITKTEIENCKISRDLKNKLIKALGPQLKPMSSAQRIAKTASELYEGIMKRLESSTDPVERQLYDDIVKEWGKLGLPEQRNYDFVMRAFVNRGIPIRTANNEKITELHQIYPYSYWLSGGNKAGFTYRALQELDKLGPIEKSKLLQALEESRIQININPANPNNAIVQIGNQIFDAKLWPDGVYTIRQIK